MSAAHKKAVHAAGDDDAIASGRQQDSGGGRPALGSTPTTSHDGEFFRSKPTGRRWNPGRARAHARLGNGGGGAFLEALGNFASLAGDFELSIRMHGFAHSELRWLGSKVPVNRPVRNMVWPAQVDTIELVERARSAVSADGFAELWDRGRPSPTSKSRAPEGISPPGDLRSRQRRLPV